MSFTFTSLNTISFDLSVPSLYIFNFSFFLAKASLYFHLQWLPPTTFDLLAYHLGYTQVVSVISNSSSRSYLQIIIITASHFCHSFTTPSLISSTNHLLHYYSLITPSLLIFLIYPLYTLTCVPS